MVLTRQQQRRQATTSEQNMSVADDSRPILGMGDREGSERQRDSLVFNRDRSTNSPRESASWSMGDHHGLNRNPDNTQHFSHAMQDMQSKVHSIEHSLQSVTKELRSVIQNLNGRKAQNSPRVHSNQTRGDVLNRRGNVNQSHSSSDTDESSNSGGATSNSAVRTNRGSRRNPKLPPFTGKETWKVWFNRFEEVASRQKWSSDAKLDELLPLLQGVAGEFVYEQLSHETRCNYMSLCKELNNRFRVVETSKAFWVQFSHRNQKYGETIEDYAAELKKLYDKAHVRRDTETRREDLLRRFLDGLIDDKARFHVEFIKEPNDIDEAVYQVVCFQQTKQKRKGIGYQNTMSVTQTDSDSDSCDKTVSRAAPGKNKDRFIENKTKDASSSQTASKMEGSLSIETLRDIVRSELQALKLNVSNDANQLKEKPPQFRPKLNQQQGYRSFNNKGQNNQGRPPRGSCFLCGDSNHYKANCPQNKAKQQKASALGSSDNNDNENNNNNGSQTLN